LRFRGLIWLSFGFERTCGELTVGWRLCVSAVNTHKTRVLDVVYNASNNELVRTKTLVKNAIVQVDATPFRQWYEQHYGVKLHAKKKGGAAQEAADAEVRIPGFGYWSLCAVIPGGTDKEGGEEMARYSVLPVSALLFPAAFLFPPVRSLERTCIAMHWSCSAVSFLKVFSPLSFFGLGFFDDAPVLTHLFYDVASPG
jgi:ribosomal protein S8E